MPASVLIISPARASPAAAGTKDTVPIGVSSGTFFLVCFSRDPTTPTRVIPPLLLSPLLYFARREEFVSLRYPPPPKRKTELSARAHCRDDGSAPFFGSFFSSGFAASLSPLSPLSSCLHTFNSSAFSRRKKRFFPPPPPSPLFSFRSAITSVLYLPMVECRAIIWRLMFVISTLSESTRVMEPTPALARASPPLAPPKRSTFEDLMESTAFWPRRISVLVNSLSVFN